MYIREEKEEEFLIIEKILLQFFNNYFKNIFALTEDSTFGIECIKLVDVINSDPELNLIEVSISNQEEIIGNTFFLYKKFINRLFSSNEASNSLWLQENYNDHADIIIPKILYFSHHNGIVIYEANFSILKQKLKENNPIKFFINNGSLLAKFHRSEENKIDLTRYLEVYKTIINNFGSNWLSEYSELMKPDIRSLGLNKAGSYGIGNYNSYTFLFHSNLSYFLNPTFIEKQPAIDRCEDIASFFIDQAYEEFLANKSVNETKKNVQQFISGYNSQIDVEISSYFEIGLTLNYQLAVNLLLKKSFEIRSVEKFQRQEINDNCYKFISYLYEQNPFNIL